MLTRRVCCLPSYVATTLYVPPGQFRQHERALGFMLRQRFFRPRPGS